MKQDNIHPQLVFTRNRWCKSVTNYSNTNINQEVKYMKKLAKFRFAIKINTFDLQYCAIQISKIYMGTHTILFGVWGLCIENKPKKTPINWSHQLFRFTHTMYTALWIKRWLMPCCSCKSVAPCLQNLKGKLGSTVWYVLKSCNFPCMNNCTIFGLIYFLRKSN